MSKPIIVDLVSGFLGAGKTTLISKYAAFRIKQGERIAIIENEFGEMGIDGELLKDAGLTVTEIVNGCICCTMKDDLTSTLQAMCGDNPPDRVIIEPTGIFIIESISEILEADSIKDTHKLSGIVTVIDALGFKRQQHRYTMFFKQQILFANRLILSKTEQMSEPEIVDTIDAQREIVGDVEIEAKNADDLTANDWSDLFSPKGCDCDCGDNCADDCDCEGDCDCHNDDEHHHHEHDHSDCDHDHGVCNREYEQESSHGGFRGITVPCLRDLSEQELSDILSRIGADEFGDIPRAKGFAPNGTGGYWQFDLVGEQIKIITSAICERDARASFIGIDMDKHVLAKLFA